MHGSAGAIPVNIALPPKIHAAAEHLIAVIAEPIGPGEEQRHASGAIVSKERWKRLGQVQPFAPVDSERDDGTSRAWFDAGGHTATGTADFNGTVAVARRL